MTLLNLEMFDFFPLRRGQVYHLFFSFDLNTMGTSPTIQLTWLFISYFRLLFSCRVECEMFYWIRHPIVAYNMCHLSSLLLWLVAMATTVMAILVDLSTCECEVSELTILSWYASINVYTTSINFAGLIVSGEVNLNTQIEPIVMVGDTLLPAAFIERLATWQSHSNFYSWLNCD